MCLPRGLPDKEREDFGSHIRRRRILNRGRMLYHAGQTSKSLYTIRSGSIKTFALSSEGDEMVEGFYYPGELLGFEALSSGPHDHFALALEATEYCEIPVAPLNRLMLRSESLQRQLIRIITRRITGDRRQGYIRNRRDARSRVAAYLVDVSLRRSRWLKSLDHFQLSMDRRDIAEYLGLTMETVSRCLTQFQREGLLRVKAKWIRLLNQQALRAVCGSDVWEELHRAVV